MVSLERLIERPRDLAKSGEFALRSGDLQEVLDDASHRASEAPGTEPSKVLEVHPDGQSLLVRAGVGWSPSLLGEDTTQDCLDARLAL